MFNMQAKCGGANMQGEDGEAAELRKLVGADAPKLEASSAEVELPGYELRRTRWRRGVRSGVF